MDVSAIQKEGVATSTYTSGIEARKGHYHKKNAKMLDQWRRSVHLLIMPGVLTSEVFFKI